MWPSSKQKSDTQSVEVVDIPAEMLERIQAATMELNLAHQSIQDSTRELKSATAALERATTQLNQAKRRPTSR